MMAIDLLLLLVFVNGNINERIDLLILGWLKHILTPKMSVLKLVNKGVGGVLTEEF